MLAAPIASLPDHDLLVYCTQCEMLRSMKQCHGSNLTGTFEIYSSRAYKLGIECQIPMTSTSKS